MVGEVAGEEERKIGEVPYRYPVIKVERIRLWPKDVLVGPAYYPYPWGFGPYGPSTTTPSTSARAGTIPAGGGEGLRVAGPT